MPRRNADRSRFDQDKWANTFPELSTRPLLMTEMKENKRLRHSFFSAVTIMMEVSLMPDRKIALRVLDVYFNETIRRLNERYKAELEAKEKRIFNEMIGCVRNIRKNLLLRIGLNNLPQANMGQHDVLAPRQERRWVRAA